MSSGRVSPPSLTADTLNHSHSPARAHCRYPELCSSHHHCTLLRKCSEKQDKKVFTTCGLGESKGNCKKGRKSLMDFWRQKGHNPSPARSGLNAVREQRFDLGSSAEEMNHNRLDITHSCSDENRLMDRVQIRLLKHHGHNRHGTPETRIL